jgi:hypothetical protein
MGTAEQNIIMAEYYNEAIRYMDNARENLKKAGKDGDTYQKALDGYFLLKDIKLPKNRKSIEFYRSHVAKIDQKLLVYLNGAYSVLHLEGYYDGILVVDIIMSGFKIAYTIIDKIKPAA